MIITVKNFKQQTFSFEFDPAKTVKKLKDKIEQECGDDYPADNQNLVYSGMILLDERTVASYNIDEKKFVVVIRIGNQARNIPSADQPATIRTDVTKTEESQPRNESSCVQKRQYTESSDANHATKRRAWAISYTDQMPPDNSFEGYNNMVENIMKMGYSRIDVQEALRAHDQNPNSAVEYLLRSTPRRIVTDTDDKSDGASDNKGSCNAGEPLGFLRSQSRFRQICVLVQQDTQFLSALLYHIGRVNFPLLLLLASNKESFIRMLYEPQIAIQPENEGPIGTIRGAGDEAVRNNRQSTVEENVVSSTSANELVEISTRGRTRTYMVTPEEREAIQRLQALGIPEHLAIQAYFACNKDEDLAAMFLLVSNDYVA